MEDTTMERRNFIRALIAVAIGIPIAVEGATFSKLFYERLFADGESSADEGEGVAVGDDLLPETPQAETVTALEFVETSGSERSFRLGIEVENSGEEPYRLKVGPLVLGNGERIEGTASTGEVPSGETASLEAEWTIPSDSTVDAVWAGAHYGSESVTREVDLAPVENPA